MSRITIVDENDNVIGSEDREIVRAKGLRHRISRVFLLNDSSQILLHRRSTQHKDNPGRWDQSAGGHVDEYEDYIDAARRETKEELGVSIAEFKAIGKFYIEREAPDGFIRRFQTIFVAPWNDEVNFDRSELAEVRWFELKDIDKWVRENPRDFTRNFPRAFGLVKGFLEVDN